MSVVLHLVIKTILYTQCRQSRLRQYVYQERLWITLSPDWNPLHPQTSHIAPSSSSNPCPPEKTIPDNRLAPTFYKLNLGRCLHQYRLPVAETWAFSIGITSSCEIQRIVCTTSNRNQLAFCRCCRFLKQSVFVARHVRADFCLHFQETFSMRTARCW